MRRLPGVRAVTPDVAVPADMYATPEQIGAPAVWEQLGGQDQAGDGVKVAIIDSGIYVTRDPTATTPATRASTTPATTRRAATPRATPASPTTR